MGLTRMALNRPIFIFMLMIGAFLIGTISYKSMRLELNPQVNLGTVTIQTQYTGASADDVNELISRKIEESVSSVSGLREVTSTSQEGLSTVQVSLELGVDTDAALNDVRSKVDAITNQLPKDALKPQVSKLDISSQPVLNLAFGSTKLNSQQLRDLLDQKLSDRFAQIPGVASAAVQGGDVREIQVQVSRDKLLAYGLGIADIQKAVAAASLDAPGGRVISGPQEYLVRVKANYTTPEQVKNTVITVSDPKDPMAKAQSVRLSDIATVLDTVQERTAYSRLNGKDTIVMAIQATNEGNAVDIDKAADASIASIQRDYANDDIKITKVFQQAKQITDSLSDVTFALEFGILLVAGIVFVFLHNFRGTLIVVCAIPTSIFASFIAMKALGFSINNMTMLAMTLAIGVLVDDAIVVIENIYRHLKLGEHPREAALNGRNEIGLAALAITLVDVVVFLPIGTMGGVIGQFFKPMALGYVCATLFSLFISFTLTPLLASRWYRAGEDMEHPTGRFAIGFEKGFARLEHMYRGALEWSLNHRWFVFLTGNVALVAVFMFIGGSNVPSQVPLNMIGKPDAPAIGIPGAVKAGLLLMPAAIVIALITTVVNGFRHRGWKLKYLLSAAAFIAIFVLASVGGYGFRQWKGGDAFKFQFFPDSDGGQVQASIELPPGASLAATQQVVSYIEGKMKADPDVKYVSSNVGTQGVGTFSAGNQGSNYAQVNATLYDKGALTDKLHHLTEKTRSRSDKSVAADLTATIGRVPGAFITVAAASGVGGGGADIQLSFTSDDRNLLMQTATKVRDGLAKGAVPGVINPNVSSKPGKLEIQVIPDRAALADKGIDASTLGLAATMLYTGNDDTKMRVNGQEYAVRVMLDPKDRNNPNIVSQIPITFKQGNPIYVGSLGTIHQEPGISKIDRRQRAEEIQVTAGLLPGYANGTVVAQLQKWLTDNHMVPEGVAFKPLGQADFQNREAGGLFGAIFIGLALVYMLLASLYDNLLYPLIIQMAQPQAMVGAMLALIITDKTLNIVGMIGIVALIGLVGKNAILLVDYTNTLRDRGRSRHDALVEAGPTRLRPISMTTSALILGMSPVALAIGRGSDFRETIGIIIIGGITLSTLLTLLVIPCSYTIFDDLSILIGRGLSRITGRGADPTEPPSPGGPQPEVTPQPLKV